MKRYKNSTIPGRKGGNIQIGFDNNGKVEHRNISPKEVFIILIKSIKPVNMVEVAHGVRVLDALDEAEKSGFIELEEGTHEWFLTKVEPLCIDLFTWDSKEVIDYLKSGFEQSKEEKDGVQT